MTEQKIINLLKMQTAKHRELRPMLDDYERLVNEIECAIAASEKRQPLGKRVEIRVRVVNNALRE